MAWEKTKDLTMITSLSAWTEARKVIADAEYLAVDTESTGLGRFEKAVGIGIAVSSNKAYYIPVTLYTPDRGSFSPWKPDAWQQVKDELIEELTSYKRLVTHNGVFDSKMLLNTIGLDIIPYIIGDTQLLHHTCISEEPPHGLKALATKFVDADAQSPQDDLKASVIANGGQWLSANKEMYKGDYKLLGTYCMYDCMYTFELFLQFYPEIEKQGLQSLWEQEVLPLMAVTFELNTTGLRVDIPYFEKLKKSMEERIAALEDEICASLDEQLVDFSYRKVLEEVTITKRSELGRHLIALGYDLEKLTDERPISKFETALSEITGKEVTRKDPKAAVLDWYKKKHNLKRVVNLDSSADKAFVLFDVLGYECTKTTKTGKRQVSANILEELDAIKKNPILDLMLDRSSEVKLLSTYVEPVLRENINGRIYPSFNQTGTISGRYSCSDPMNFQTLPREDLRIKAGFIPDPGYVFVNADFASLEPRCLRFDTKVDISGKGKVPILEAKVGDLVNTVEGYRKITNVWESRKTDTYVITNKGALIASPEHKVWADGEWTEVQALTVESKLQRHVAETSSVPEVTLPIYSTTSLVRDKEKPIGVHTLAPDMAWLLGAYLGDGYCRLESRASSATTIDMSKVNTLNIESSVNLIGLEGDGVVQKFEKVVDAYGFRASSCYDKRSPGLKTVTVSGHEFTNLLTNTFQMTYRPRDREALKPALGKKSKKFRIPAYIYSAPVELKLAFLAGLIDTDGTVTSHNGTFVREVVVSSSHPELASDLIQLYDSMGLVATMGLGHRHRAGKLHRGFQVKLLQAGAYELARLNVMQYMAHTKKAEKLAERLLKVPKPQKQRPLRILEIYSGSESRMFDIEVEGNHEFVADGFRVHNCFAAVSDETAIKDVYKRHLDLYSQVAIQVLGLKGVSADENDENFLKKIDPQARQIAKVITLAFAYGMSEYKAAKTLKVSVEEALRLRNKYFLAFPNLTKYQEKQQFLIKKYGFVSNLVHRRRRAKVVPALYKAGITKMDYRGVSKEWGRVSRLVEPFGILETKKALSAISNEFNNSYNFPIQSLAASICNVAMIELQDKLLAEGLNAKITLNVHDEITLLASVEHAERAAVLLQESMEVNRVSKMIDVPMKAVPIITSKSLAEAK